MGCLQASLLRSLQSKKMLKTKVFSHFFLLEWTKSDKLLAGEKEDLDTESALIHWHPAFIEALKLELAEYEAMLEFQPEFQLTAEPLRIDCVIVKKIRKVKIKKNIAAIFRDINILEYKSPNDYVSVADFYKVYGYACLYTVLEKVPITNLTISFIESRKPEKLLEHLKNVRHYDVAETSQGIYTIKGDILPIQIIDSSRLLEDENLWLRHLNNRLNPAAIIEINEAVIKHDKTAKIQAYIHAIVKANHKAVEEAIRMRNASKALDEVLIRTGMVAMWEARAEARLEASFEARAEAKIKDIVKNMIDLGFPHETIAKVISLDLEKVKTMC